MSAVQKLQEEVSRLPEAIAVEVLDFLEFVRKRQQSTTPSTGSSRGAMRGQLSSSGDFAQRKQAEIQLEA